MMLNCKAVEYAQFCVKSEKIPRYVKKQARDFLRIASGKDKKYMLSERKVRQIENVLKLLNMPKGHKAGESLYECTDGFQWLFYTGMIAVVHRSDQSKRRYERGLLEEARKNYKTFTVATLQLLLFFIEPKYSEFYSVAPDGTISKRIKDTMMQIIESSPMVAYHNGKPRFKVLNTHMKFLPTKSVFTPLAFSNNRMDSREPNAFIADEVGALPTSYPIDAMRSGQMNIKNPLGFIISTKYPTIDNPLEVEVDYAKKVLDGVIKDDRCFSLLYEPDNVKNWETDDLIMWQANPAAINNPAIWENLKTERAYAIAVESARENFLTKHCNIIYQGIGTETYVDVADVQACKVSEIDWTGRVVYVGVDLSQTDDNTAVAIVTVDEDNKILADSFAFIPADRIEAKTANEHVEYRELAGRGKVFACGDRVIDYGAVEEFVLSLEEKLGVQIQAIGYDRYNAISSAQKFENAGYNTVEIRQHSSVLHPPTKLLKEKILSEEFAYTTNPLLEINFQNAKCTLDTNKNQYVNKKKSNGKVDMVVALINALYLAQQDYFLNNSDFVAQVI